MPFADKDEERRTLMETMFREHYSSVHAFIFSKVGRYEVADDLTSLVFLKAFRWLLEDRGMRQVRRWLYTTARTTLADYWQEQITHSDLPLEAFEENLSAPFAPLENEQAQKRVQRLFSCLPMREREVLRLRYVQGYTAAEIGQTLGLSAGNVRVLQLRAVRRAALFEERNERMLEQMTEKDFLYTEEGRRVVELAKEEALALKQYYIGTEHLLLGVLAEGSAAVPLIEQGITLEHVHAGLLFLIGKDKGEPNAEITFTPQARHVLGEADQEARANGEMLINPEHILYALQNAENEYGIAYGLLQSLGLERRAGKRILANEYPDESALSLQEYLIDLSPPLTPEEEQQLAHQVTRGEKARKRAAFLNTNADSQIIEEGKMAYFRLFMANQGLVLSIAKEYPGKQMGRLLEAGNRGLTYAIHKFGLKTQVPFHAYASHWIHLEIIESVLN